MFRAFHLSLAAQGICVCAFAVIFGATTEFQAQAHLPNHAADTLGRLSLGRIDPDYIVSMQITNKHKFYTTVRYQIRWGNEPWQEFSLARNQSQTHIHAISDGRYPTPTLRFTAGIFGDTDYLKLNLGDSYKPAQGPYRLMAYKLLSHTFGETHKPKLYQINDGSRNYQYLYLTYDN